MVENYRRRKPPNERLRDGNNRRACGVQEKVKGKFLQQHEETDVRY